MWAYERPRAGEWTQTPGMVWGRQTAYALIRGLLCPRARKSEKVLDFRVARVDDDDMTTAQHDIHNHKYGCEDCGKTWKAKKDVDVKCRPYVAPIVWVIDGGCDGSGQYEIDCYADEIEWNAK